MLSSSLSSYRCLSNVHSSLSYTASRHSSLSVSSRQLPSRLSCGSASADMPSAPHLPSLRLRPFPSA